MVRSAVAAPGTSRSIAHRFSACALPPATNPSMDIPSAAPSSRHSLSTKFETELQVRPDDIDMNRHVHNARYFDYVLAARYDQMARCYRMPMEEFLAAGFGWVVRTAHVQYKRPLGLGDWMIVRTWVEEIVRAGVKVQFEIARKANGKLCADGYFDYTMVSLATGRAETIPDWIGEKYAI
jgi:acyl-CoA thioester hydrolase/thioesterase-3